MSHVDAVHAPLAGGECRGTTAASSVNGSERPNADVGGVLVAGTGCGAGAGVNANAYDSYYYELSWLGGDGPCGYRRHAVVRTWTGRSAPIETQLRVCVFAPIWRHLVSAFFYSVSHTGERHRFAGCFVRHAANGGRAISA